MVETDQSVAISLPEDLRAQFERLERRLFRVETGVLVAGTVAGLAGSYLLIFASDRLWDSPMWLRGTAFVGGVAVVGWFTTRWLKRWILKRRTQKDLAAIVQRRFQRLGDRLLGIVELSSEEKHLHGSAELYRAAIRQGAPPARRDSARRRCWPTGPARGGRPVAWLSPGCAATTTRPGSGAMWSPRWTGPGRGSAERVGPLLGPPAPSSFEGLVTALINELAAEPGADEVLLVLDDYHLIDAQPVHESVAFLLEHLPPGLRVVVASRADPPLPLARLRARGQLAELRAADLRFTAEEAAALLRRGGGAGLPDAAVAALAARTEGWAAGLQLAALSLRGQADVGRVRGGVQRQPPLRAGLPGRGGAGPPAGQVRAFLLETSVLERLSGALCDAVTGRAGSQAMLEEVERAGLFLVPLDEVRGWWRYHHLFADLLRARLQAEQPGRVRGAAPGRGRLVRRAWSGR